MNIAFGNSFVCSGVNTGVWGYNSDGTGSTICYYGSNLVSDYNTTSNVTITSTMTLLATLTYNGSTFTNAGFCAVTNTTPFQYYIVIASGSGFPNISIIQIQHSAGGYTPILNGTDYTISSSATNGAPIITYTDSSTQNLTYNENMILLSESYRRLYPVIHDTSNLFLSGSSGWNISSNSNSTNLCFNYNSSNKCYHDITGNIYITGDLYRSGTSLTSVLNNFVTNSSLSSTLSSYITNTSLTSSLSNLNTVNISNASWCRYQAINNSTAISIPASTSLLVLNCTYTGNVTINFDQPISNYCQAGISVFFTGTSPSSWILNNINGNILFYDASGEQYSYTNTYTMVYYAGFYLKFTFSNNNVTCYANNTPTNLMLPQSGCIVCDTSNYNYTLTIPSTLSGSLMIKNSAIANQTGTVTLNGVTGTFIDGNSSYSKILTYPNCILFSTILNNIITII